MRYASFVSHCFRVFYLDNHGSWEHQRRFCLCSITLVDLSLKTVLRGTNTPHTCIPGLVWQKKHFDFHNLSSKSANSDFPFTLYVLARHYTTGGTRPPFLNVGKYQNGTSYTRVSARHYWDARAPLWVSFSKILSEKCSKSKRLLIPSVEVENNYICNFRWRLCPYPFPNPIFTLLKIPYLNRNNRR